MEEGAVIKVTRIITYIYASEKEMQADINEWQGVENGIIVRLPSKTILSETSQPTTLPAFNL